jgi:hypothetical protein
MAYRTLLYQLTPLGYQFHSFGNMFSPVNFRRAFAELVSYYAFFKGWLLLSQLPSC